MGILDSLLGNSAADASNAAAADTFKKQQAATGAIRGAGQQYATDVGGLSENFAPFANAGKSALAQLMAGLGLDGDQEAFTKAYQGLPGYQSGLATGTQSVMRGLNAGGVLNSGRAKALQRYGSDYEDQRSGDYLSRLMGLTTMGQSAVGAGTGLQAEGFRGRLGADTAAFGGDMTAAGTVGQGMVAGEQAKQSALQNLLGTAAYVAGSALGGGGKPGGGKSPMPSPYSMYGTFADGGRPPVDEPSIVGEEGPEIFVPDQSGTVLPNSVLELLLMMGRGDMARPRVGPFAEDASLDERPRVGPFPQRMFLKNSDRR